MGQTSTFPIPFVASVIDGISTQPKDANKPATNVKMQVIECLRTLTLSHTITPIYTNVQGMGMDIE